MNAPSKQFRPVRSRTMRGLTIVLFVFGSFWAFWNWLLILMPMGMFEPKYQYQAHDVVGSLVASATSAVGYFVWFGWLFFAVKARFPLVQWRSFWLGSLLQHSAWLFVLPYLREENIADFIGSSELLFPKMWIFANVLIALFCLLAEPGSSPDPGSDGAPPAPAS